MGSDDRIWYLIERIKRLEDRLDALRPAGDVAGGSEVRLGVTTRIGATYPTAIGAYYAVQTANPTGSEVEGTAAGHSVPAGAAKYLAQHKGTVAPPEGTVVFVESIGPRWVFRYDG